MCSSNVATVLTVYGIETLSRRQQVSPVRQVATVLTVYGIETRKYFQEYASP